MSLGLLFFFISSYSCYVNFIHIPVSLGRIGIKIKNPKGENFVEWDGKKPSII